MSDERKYMGPALVVPVLLPLLLLLLLRLLELLLLAPCECLRVGEKDFSSWAWWLPLMIMMTSQPAKLLPPVPETRDRRPETSHSGRSPSFIKSGPSSQQQPLGFRALGSLDLFYASFSQIFPVPPLPRSLFPSIPPALVLGLGFELGLGLGLDFWTHHLYKHWASHSRCQL